MLTTALMKIWPDNVVQSLAHLSHEPEVPGLIPVQPHTLLIQEGQLLAKVCALCTG